MLEPNRRNRPAFANVAALRNVVEINAKSDSLGYLCAWLARRSRVIRIRELGPHTTNINMTLPVNTPIGVYMPAAAALMQGRAGFDARHLDAVLGNSLPTRMLVVHEVLSEPLLAQVADCFVPEIACAAQDASPSDDWFVQRSLCNRPDVVSNRALKGWGVPSLQFWTTDRGAEVLGASLAMFDNFHRGLKREAARVYGVRDLLLSDGFYPVESDGGNHWAWTGPETLATILIPSHGSTRLTITLFFFGAQIPIDAHHLEISVDDRLCKILFASPEKVVVAADQLSEGCCHRVEILQRRTVFLADGSRKLGCALHKVSVEVR